MRAKAMKVVTTAARRSVLLEEAKDHLRVDGSDFDVQLLSILAAADTAIELQTGRTLITTTRDAYYDRFSYMMDVPAPPLAAITDVFYQDEDDVEQTVTSSIYREDIYSEPGRIILDDGETWPDIYPVPLAVRIRYTSGYGDAPSDVPEPLRQAVLFKIQMLYDSDHQMRETLSETISALVAPYVVHNF